MELFTKNLLLRTVDDNDVIEVARMWKFEQGEIPLDEAKKAIEYMQNNHRQNREGYIKHLCFAVFEKEKNSIIGWCGIDGDKIFFLIDSKYRNKGYATQCAAKLLEYAMETIKAERIFGGCDKENIASYRVMEKSGMGS